MSDRNRPSKKQRANELKLERLINDESNKAVFLKKSKSKNLANATGDHDRAMGNTSKCEEEKT